MDALTDVLRAMRLSGAVFLDAEFTAPWCILSKLGPEDCRPFMAPPARIVAYHYVVEGRLSVSIGDEPPLDAAAGDLLVFPRNDAHRLASDPERAPVSAGELIEPAGEDGLARIRHGGGGARSRLLCGFLGSHDRTDPLLASLPPVLRLGLGDRLTGSWIEGSMRFAARELAAGGPGAAASLARLSELLFTEAVRQYAGTLAPDSSGWLAGLRDPYVGRAIALIHTRLAEPWTLDALARAAGLSRSALAERFVRHMGTSPMRYLGRRRLAHAADCLRGGRQPVARIAYRVGYESEAAFSRSFKREFGISPAAFRKAAQEP